MTNLNKIKLLDGVKLYSYWRSSASWRIRWTLLHKRIPFELSSVNLLKGEHRTKDFRSINPACSLPVLQLSNGETFIESSAIFEFIEEVNPSSNLLPLDIKDRMLVRELAQLVVSGIHPLQNLKVLTFLFEKTEDKSNFAAKWIREGLEIYCELLIKHRCTGLFSFEDSLSFADLCLIPQLYNARRHGVNISKEFPTLEKIESECFKLECGKLAHPDQQPDAAKTI